MNLNSGHLFELVQKVIQKKIWAQRSLLLLFLRSRHAQGIKNGSRGLGML